MNDKPILVVEDDVEDQILIKVAFEKTNAVKRVYCISDGEELIEYLEMMYKEGKQPFLILLDLNMPKKNGFETLCDLKNSGSFAHIPVVILTTSSVKEEVRKCYQLGANGFVNKPSDIGVLTNRLSSLINYWTSTKGEV